MRNLVVCLFVGVSCWAQTPEGHDRWLMQNYRFVTPPPPEATETVTPAVAQLQEIQNTLLSILRKANFAGSTTASIPAISGFRRRESARPTS